MNEPVGVVGIVAPEAPGLLPFVTLMAAAITTGNTAVMIPSEQPARCSPPTSTRCSTRPTCRAAWSTSSPATGAKLGLELAKHDAVDAIWYFGPRAMAEAFEKASTGNLKQTWCETVARDWSDDRISAGRDVLARATQVKNIWVPYGE